MIAASNSGLRARCGAGELLVTSVDREGTRKGFDLHLTRRIADAVPIPVIASGGAGSVDDVAAVIRDGHADAVAVASLLHYGNETIGSLKSGLSAGGILVPRPAPDRSAPS